MFKIFIFSLIATCNLLAESQLWTLRDLELAQSKKDYNHIRQHLFDLAPSQRNNSWYQIFKLTILNEIEQTSPTDSFLINLDTLDQLKSIPREILDFDSIIKVAKFLRLNTTPSAHATPWFLLAKKNYPNNTNLCEDPDLKLSVLSGLYLAESETQLLEATKELVKLCWETLEADLKEELSQANSYYYKNTCAFFKKTNSLKSGSLIFEACKDY